MLLMLCLLFGRAHAQDYQPTSDILQAQERFQDQKLGIFIHWGIYSMMADGEWILNSKNLKTAEYAHLAHGFYPARFDAAEWIAAFKDAGARYITFTTRHHDGFSMFRTAASPYNIVDATPYRHDVLADLAKACAASDLSLHLYYSHLDWGRADYPMGRTGRNTGRPDSLQNYDSYLSFMKTQLTELLTQYGKIGCIWFDGWWDHDEDSIPFDWRLPEQYALIHSLQPSCLVANNNHQPPFPGEDIQIFERDVPGENKAGLSGQAVSSLPLETCETMNGSWGYRMSDMNYKSTKEIVHLLVNTAGRNANLLLNVGPRPDGSLPEVCKERLKELGQWMRTYGQSIYGTRGGIVPPQSWGATTQKGNTLYVHILQHDSTMLEIPLMRRIRSAKLFGKQEKIRYKQSRTGTMLYLPSKPVDYDTIVELELK